MLFSPATVSSPSTCFKVIALSAPLTITDAQAPTTFRELLEPPTLGDLPGPQSISALVPNDP